VPAARSALPGEESEQGQNVPPPGLRGGVGRVRLRLNQVLAESVPPAPGDGNGSSDGNGHRHADHEDQDAASANPAVPRGS
jgi:hypothetical protein